jgi:sugar lactone lactonase YvrE
VAVDSDGDVYVCDWANDRIQIFGTDGAFITSLLGDAREPSKAAMGIIETNPEMVQQLHEMPDQAAIGRFSFPTGIAFDPEKHRILVTDSQRGRLQIYDKVKS